MSTEWRIDEPQAHERKPRESPAAQEKGQTELRFTVQIKLTSYINGISGFLDMSKRGSHVV